MKPCKCGSTKIAPSRLRQRQYICTKCFNATPVALRARKRYVQRRRNTAEGQAYERSQNARRIRYNDHHFGYARTPDEKQAIQAHIQKRVHAFKGQSSGAKTEGHSDGAVAAAAALGDDRLA